MILASEAGWVCPSGLTACRMRPEFASTTIWANGTSARTEDANPSAKITLKLKTARLRRIGRGFRAGRERVKGIGCLKRSSDRKFNPPVFSPGQAGAPGSKRERVPGLRITGLMFTPASSPPVN